MTDNTEPEYKMIKISGNRELSEVFAQLPGHILVTQEDNKIYVFDSSEQTLNKFTNSFAKDTIEVVPSVDTLYEKARKNFNIDKFKCFIEQNKMLKEVRMTVESTQFETNDIEEAFRFANKMIEASKEVKVEFIVKEYFFDEF